MLSRMILREKQKGNIRGYKITSRIPAITYVQFADDTLLFGQASVQEEIGFNKDLLLYSLASGLRINLKKSGTLCSTNTPILRKQQIGNMMNIGEMAALSKYLGILMDWARTRTQLCNTICERVQQKVSSWKNKFLLAAGKDILIKAVLHAILSFIMSVFKLP